MGYVKTMVKIGWGVWVFHSKGLEILAAASNLEEARDRSHRLLEDKADLESKVEAMEQDLAHGKSVGESHEHKLRTLSSRLEKSKADLADAKKDLSAAQTELEETKKKQEDSEKVASESAKQKEDQLKAKEAELAALEKKLAENAAGAEKAAREEQAKPRAQQHGDLAPFRRRTS